MRTRRTPDDRSVDLLDSPLPLSSVERSAVVAASADAAWKVLSDFGSLSSWVPLVQHSCLLSDRTEGVGTVRRVQIARQTLVETVVTWDPAGTLAYSIEGLPPMVRSARNTWTLTPAGRVTEVTLATQIDTGRNPVRRVLGAKVLARMALASELMLTGLQAAAMDADAAPAAGSSEDNR